MELIEGLSLDELDSLVASLQADSAPPDVEYYPSRLAEYLDATVDVILTDRPGEWILDVYGEHALLMRRDDVWYTDALHVGLRTGRCSSSCRAAVADVQERVALLNVVKAWGQTWRLSGDPNLGAPMYVADDGWVVREVWCDRKSASRPWLAGRNYDGAECGRYRTMREAMRAARDFERQRVRDESRCPYCDGTGTRRTYRAVV